MILLGVDPSVNNVGLAIYDTVTRKLVTTTHHPLKTEEDWAAVGSDILFGIRTFLLRLQLSSEEIAMAVMEYPSWQDSAKGKVAAKKGYTLNLAFIVGFLSGGLRLHSSNVFLPTPLQWKKNLPKEAVGRRFEKRFGISADSVTDHEFEAAMMIAWLMEQVGHPDL